MPSRVARWIVCWLALPWVVGATETQLLEIADQIVESPFHRLAVIVPSPDGRHLYTAGSREGIAGSIGFWELDDTGAPSFRRTWTDLDLGVDGLVVDHMVTAPDGRHLVAIRRSDPVANGTEILVLERSVNGELGLVQAIDTVTSDAAARVQRLVISPDGNHLYALGLGSIHRFDRAADGRLSWSQNQVLDVSIRNAVISDDGRTFFATGSDVLIRFSRDTTTGELTLEWNFDDLPGSCCLDSTGFDIWSMPDGGLAIHARTSPGIDGEDQVLLLEPSTGNLMQVVAGGPIGYGEMHVAGVTVDSLTGTIFTSTFTTDDTLGRTLRAYRRDGALLRELAARASDWATGSTLMPSPDGRFLYAGPIEQRALGAFKLMYLDLDGLVLAGSFPNEPPGTVHPKQVLRAPMSRDVYVGGVDAIVHFRHQPEGLREIGRLTASVAPRFLVEESLFRRMALSPDGSLLVATLDESLGVARRGLDGQLTWISQQRVAGFGHDWLAFSPDGAHLYASSLGRIDVYAVGVEGLTLVDWETGICGPIEFASDGTIAYLAGSACGANSVIARRDPISGDLDPIDGLSDASQFLVDPEERYLYAFDAPCELDDEIGELRLRTYRIGADTSAPQLIDHQTFDTGSECPRTVSKDFEARMDADGRFVYFRDRLNDSLLVFRRNPTSGRLALVERFRPDLNPELATALDSPRSIDVSPYGEVLYVASTGDAGSTVTALRRPCRAGDPLDLCLGGSRFRAEARWTDAEGRLGDGRSVVGTADSGLLWFFSDNNWEMLIKVLDACPLNGHYWVYAGASTDVGYRLDITDTWTGDRVTYSNPLGVEANPVADTSAFDGCSVPGPAGFDLVGSPVIDNIAGGTMLDLGDGRFTAEIAWRDGAGQTGDARVAELRTDDSGLFTFFDADNYEVLVKVLDGCALNGKFWVFTTATTDVETTLTITDTVTGAERTYFNPLGRRAPAVTDTNAFACGAPDPDGER